MTAQIAGLPARKASSDWLRGLRVYLGVITVGNLGWETLQLPLYTIWSTGTAREQVFGVAYTVFSEWRNVTVHSEWTYSDWMPVLSLLGLKIGLSPLLQWAIVPA